MLKKLSVFIFGERLQSHLPERVRESIAQQQCESEKFISWVQLLLVVTFGIRYALAPSSAPEAGVQPVPWILSAYFIFTMVCLIGSHRGQLSNWLLMASEVMDIVLLMVLIWSFHIFHIQYTFGPLRAPTSRPLPQVGHAARTPLAVRLLLPHSEIHIEIREIVP